MDSVKLDDFDTRVMKKTLQNSRTGLPRTMSEAKRQEFLNDVLTVWQRKTKLKGPKYKEAGIHAMTPGAKPEDLEARQFTEVLRLHHKSGCKGMAGLDALADIALKAAPKPEAEVSNEKLGAQQSITPAGGGAPQNQNDFLPIPGQPPPATNVQQFPPQFGNAPQTAIKLEPDGQHVQPQQPSEAVGQLPSMQAVQQIPTDQNQFPYQQTGLQNPPLQQNVNFAPQNQAPTQPLVGQTQMQQAEGTQQIQAIKQEPPGLTEMTPSLQPGFALPAQQFNTQIPSVSGRTSPLSGSPMGMDYLLSGGTPLPAPLPPEEQLHMQQQKQQLAQLTPNLPQLPGQIDGMDDTEDEDDEWPAQKHFANTWLAGQMDGVGEEDPDWAPEEEAEKEEDKVITTTTTTSSSSSSSAVPKPTQFKEFTDDNRFTQDDEDEALDDKGAGDTLTLDYSDFELDSNDDDDLLIVAPLVGTKAKMANLGMRHWTTATCLLTEKPHTATAKAQRKKFTGFGVWNVRLHNIHLHFITNDADETETEFGRGLLVFHFEQ
eukprot:TRINITY_DN26203_c0_g2_i1.p1 TRINITY_DN26203_c0_g2~~TRINITY_DN26203_c0_g2_i1.p1  ORF type:complete len:542 (-),score=81.53 TRINITY_DN26203_c0_g2_i1:947-2572(-)